MGDVKLSTPRVRVLREGHEELELQVTNADLILWDKTRYRHKWPPVSEAPFVWLTFVSWAAARRTGAISPDHRYEAWEEEVLEVSSVDEEPDDEEGTPTLPGLVPG